VQRKRIFFIAHVAFYWSYAYSLRILPLIKCRTTRNRKLHAGVYLVVFIEQVVEENGPLHKANFALKLDLWQ
jgi:hypothetical protein